VHIQPNKYSNTSKYAPDGSLIDRDDESALLDLPLSGRESRRRKTRKKRDDETAYTQRSMEQRGRKRKRRASSK
jgi:hypothetical protein